MKLKFLPLLPAILVTILLTSCGGGKSDVPVPEDAAVVIHFDGASLNSKLSWEEVRQSEWMKKAEAESTDSLAKKLMANPEESGLDIKSDAYIFIVTRGKGGYAGMTCKLKDEKKFEAFLAHVRRDASIAKQDGLSVIKDKDHVISWKSDRVVFIADAGDFNGGAKNFGNSHKFPEDSLMKFAKNVHDLKKKNSLGNNSKFTSMLKEKGDVHFWFDGGRLGGNSMGEAAIMLPKLASLTQGNYTAATLSFEDGRIVADAKSYYNKELEDLYKKFKYENLDEAALKKIPSGNVAGVIALKYPPEAIKELTSFLGVDALINMFINKAGYSIEEFVKATKGDAVIALTDFTMTKKTATNSEWGTTSSSPEPSFKLLFATSINDRASFDKLISVITEQFGKMGGDASAAINKIPHQVKDNWFITGNDSSFINAYGSTTTDHAFISKISGHPMGGYIDIQKILAGVRPAVVDSLSKMTPGNTETKFLDEAAKYWQDIVFYGGEFKDGATVSHLEINMVDKKTNSLKQFNNFIGALGNVYFHNRDVVMRELEMQKDSVTVTVPNPR